jgi:hypothetical protein
MMWRKNFVIEGRTEKLPNLTENMRQRSRNSFTFSFASSRFSSFLIFFLMSGLEDCFHATHSLLLFLFLALHFCCKSCHFSFLLCQARLVCAANVICMTAGKTWSYFCDDHCHGHSQCEITPVFVWERTLFRSQNEWAAVKKKKKESNSDTWWGSVTASGHAPVIMQLTHHLTLPADETRWRMRTWCVLSRTRNQKWNLCAEGEGKYLSVISRCWFVCLTRTMSARLLPGQLGHQM